MRFFKVVLSLVAVLSLSSCLKDVESLEDFYPNRDAGIAFLEANKQREEVVVTESGLQYEVLNEGDGYGIKATDHVKYKFVTSKIDGTEVLSSGNVADEDLASFPAEMLSLLGLNEGVTYMKIGSKYKFYIPYELAYGILSIYTYEPFSVVIVEIEATEMGAESSVFFNPEVPEGAEIENFESGLLMVVKEKGEGNYPTDFATIPLAYKGMLVDGTLFDETEEGKPIYLNIDSVIPGFSEGLKLMKPGAKATMYIPYYLAYGSQGLIKNNGQYLIPPYATLIFDVEHVKETAE